jgi:hypothetical protein
LRKRAEKTSVRVEWRQRISGLSVLETAFLEQRSTCCLSEPELKINKMRCRDTSRMIGVFAAQFALIALLCAFAGYFSLKTLETLAMLAFFLPVIGYSSILIRPSVYKSWCEVFREVGLAIVSCIARTVGFFSVRTILRVCRVVARMRVFPSGADEWFALMLFPFKVYVLAGVPMIWFYLWLKRVMGLQFGGMYSGDLGENVALIYFPCLGMLLFGALIQAKFSTREQSSRTASICVAGFAFLLFALF